MGYLRVDRAEWSGTLFSFCPVEQKGCHAVFSDLCIGPRVGMSHETDPQAEKGKIAGVSEQGAGGGLQADGGAERGIDER